MVREIILGAARAFGDGSGVDRGLLQALSLAIDSRKLTTYAPLRKYWDGDHNVMLTDRMKQFLSNSQIKDGKFSDNFMGVVIAAVSERLDVQGFTVPGEPSADDGSPGALAQFANDQWALNRMDSMQKDVYNDALALGESYVITEWDEVVGGVRMSFNPPELIRIEYDDGNYLLPTRATKKWNEQVLGINGTVEEHTRMNVYYDNRIEKYTSAGRMGSDWRKWSDVPGGQWPIPWVDSTGFPLGIPVAHFLNNARGTTTGRSELKDLVNLQDAINKALVDGVRVADSQGWPQRWATGLDSNQSDDIQASPGTIMHAGAPDSKFGEFPSADPTGAIAWMEHLTAHLAFISQTPQHLFRISGNTPSGEALKTAEAPLVRKVEDRQAVYGNSWEDVMVMAAAVANARGELGLEVPDTGFDTDWAEAETRSSEKERIEGINLKEGISLRQRMREYGYDSETITRIEDELKQEPDDIADALARAFNRGDGAAEGAAAAANAQQQQ
tara:strand:+ start:2919 stop:4418 length:1500 start_codon:yes stop_codon:yes gene_type:complete